MICEIRFQSYHLMRYIAEQRCDRERQIADYLLRIVCGVVCKSKLATTRTPLQSSKFGLFIGNGILNTVNLLLG